MNNNIFKDEDLSGIINVSPPKKDMFKGEDVSWLKPQRKERMPREIQWQPFREPLQKLVKPFEKVEKGIEKVGKKIIEKPSPETWKGAPTYMYRKGVPTEKESKLLEKPTYEIYTKPPYVRTKQLADITLKGEVKKATSEMFKDIGYHLKPYLPWKWTEPEGIVGKTIDFTEKAIDSAGQFVADPSEYDEEGNLTLFPKIRGAMLLGVLVVEGAALAGGMKAGLAYRKSMQTFEKWKKTLGERKLKVEFDKYLKSTKFKDIQRNMRTYFEKATKWFRRKPKPVGERVGREIRVRGRLPEIGKKELLATKEEIAIKNIEQTIRQAGQVDRNLKKAGFEIERPAYYLKTEQKPFITDNIIVVKNIPTAEGGRGVALANIKTGNIQLFKNPIELKQEILRLAMDNIVTPEKKIVEKMPELVRERKQYYQPTKEEALTNIKSIMPRIRELSTHITASKSIGAEIEPETYTELERLNDRISELMPVAYPETAEKVRPEVTPPVVAPPTERLIISPEEEEARLIIKSGLKPRHIMEMMDMAEKHRYKRADIEIHIKEVFGWKGQQLKLAIDDVIKNLKIRIRRSGIKPEVAPPEEPLIKVDGLGELKNRIQRETGQPLTDTEKQTLDTLPQEESAFIKDLVVTRIPETLTGFEIMNKEQYNMMLIEFMEKESKEAMRGEITLYQAVKKLGGIKSYKKGAPGALVEEYNTTVPVFLRNKGGRALDEMATALGEQYPQFGVEIESELLEVLKREKVARINTVRGKQGKHIANKANKLIFGKKPSKIIQKTLFEPEEVVPAKVKPSKAIPGEPELPFGARPKFEVPKVKPAPPVPEEVIPKPEVTPPLIKVTPSVAPPVPEVVGEKKLIKEIPKKGIKIYEQVGLRRLEKYEVNRVLTDLEMTAFKIPPADADIKRSLEDVVGTLRKEEMDAAIKDIRAYTEKPTEQSTETMLDGGSKADENAFPEEWQRWRALGRQWGQLTNEEKAEFWEIADKISDRISEGVIPPDEMLGFPLGDLKEDWKLGGMKGFLSTAGGILPYGLDIHAWFPKHAIRSARAVKTMMSKQEMMHKMGEWVIRKINKAGKPLGITNEDYVESFLPATQRTLLRNYSPEQQKKFKAIFEITDKFFEEQLTILKKKGILRMGFVERVVREAKENIGQYRVAQSIATSSGEKAGFELQIKQEQEVLEFVKKMDVRYIHLPVKLLLEQMWEKPALKKYLKLSRFFRRRETLDVASWLKELKGLRYPEAVRNTKAIKKEIEEGKVVLVKGSIDDKELVVTRPVLDRGVLDIRRVIAVYSNKLGRLYGLADIVNAFQHDGLIRNLPTTGIVPDGWTTLPTGVFPEFQGKIAKGVVADWLQEYLGDTLKRGIGLSRFFAYFKLMQFTRLLFMPYYDVQQASIHWGLRWALMKPHKIPGVIKKAIKSFVKKDEHFWNFWNYGGTSKPFAAPFKSYMNEVEVLLQETGMKKLVKFMSYHYKTPVDFLYLPIWNINWAGDEFVRLISYHAMLEEGHIPEEAAQIAATAHSDYARMPAQTRRKLNKILFVPVFPVTMAMWEYEMLKAAVLESMRIGAAGLGKVFPSMKRLEAKLTPTADEMFKRRKSMAKGLLGFVMMVALREGIQRALGFKTKVLGLSSTQIVDDPDNPGQQKELVKYIPTPDNVLLRHIFRWSGLPSEPDKLDLFATKLGGILHPLLAFPIECLRNRKRDYTSITEISQIWGGPEGWAKMGLDYMAYAGERLVPILKSVPGLATEYKEERNKAIQEWRKCKGPYWVKRIMEPFIFLYMRNTKDRRGMRQAREFLRIIRQEAREAERIKGKPLSEEELKRYDDRIRRMEEVLTNLKEYETKSENPWEHIEENLEGIVK